MMSCTYQALQRQLFLMIPQFPIVKEFQSQIQGINMIQLQAIEAKKQIVEGNLLDLLEWSRPQKKGEKNPSTIFNYKVEITSIRTKEGWYYFLCNSGKCKKTLSLLDGNFWCESCEEVNDYPTIGFRVHINVQDASASVVVTMFDDTVEKLVNRKAADLLQELDEVGCDDTVLPDAL